MTLPKNKLNINKIETPYLLYECFSNNYNNADYPYPAKMHPVLAYIGSKSLMQYIDSIPKRKEWLYKLLKIIEDEQIPKMYFNTEADIVPLRLAYILKFKSREQFKFIDDWIWFKQPIVATQEKLERFGYYEGMCPISEMIGNKIMNLPILTDCKQQEIFLIKIKEIYK